MGLLIDGIGISAAGVDYAPTATGDFDGDGYPDILAFAYTSGLYRTFYAVIGKSSGGTDFHVQESGPLLTFRGTIGMAGIADLNNDHKLDFVSVIQQSISPGYVTYDLGNGDGTFVVPPVKIPGTDGASYASVSDVNGDGKPDVVVGFASGHQTFYGDGAGNFSTTPP